MNILITGGTGFIGRHLVKYLIEKYPHYRLFLFGRESSNWKAIAEFEQTTTHIQRLIGTEELNELSSLNIHAVIHLATDYGNSSEQVKANIYHLNQTNVQLGLQLLNLAECCDIPFLYSDTFFVEANKDYPYMVEYIKSKQYFFEWLNYYAAQKRVRIHNLRLFHPFGEGDKVHKFFPNITRQCLQNVPIIDLTEGLQKRDFIYIEDVVSAFVCTLNHATNFDVAKDWWNYYEVGYGVGTSVRQLVEWIKQYSQSKSQLNFGAIPMRKGEFVGNFANNTSLMEIGWKPAFSVQTGVEKAIKLSKDS